MNLRLVVLFVLTVTVKCLDNLQFIHQFHISERDITSEKRSNGINFNRRFRRDVDEKCTTQESTFLQDIYRDKKRIEEKREFTDDTNTGMALAWAGTGGTMIVVTTEEAFGVSTGASNVYRTKDYGLHFDNITSKLSPNKPIYIRKHAGIFRHPNNPNRVYLVSVHSGSTTLYITEDSGETFISSELNFEMDGQMQFNDHNENYLLASFSVLTVQTVYVSEDNGRNWRRIMDGVQLFKWGQHKGVDNEKTIYAAADSSNTHPFFAAFMGIKYDLKKSTDLGVSWSTLMKGVESFGHQDKFIYAAVQESSESDVRKMLVSSDGGKTWDKTYLPRMNGERFFSVLDMNEGLVFMHVDNPGDTGHGTLYTSSGKGRVYSESLTKHLYPNYGDTTDFFRVMSMRGVYLASQMRDDNSIHTVISYNLGGTWHPVPKPDNAPCKDPTKDCALQIHGSYSINRGIISELPLSVPSAPGLILVHGHVADALQTTKPDVFITTDGGYKWRKALDGPHHYHIADSGSLLVAVPADTPSPSVIKFSTDEGRCWHSYEFIKQGSNETIMFTGLLTEPGSKSLTVSVWGYRPDTKKWTAFIIDFHKIFTDQCNVNTDYETWIPHENNNEKGNIQGCLLGKKETFTKVKQDSWCYNGLQNSIEKDGSPCICVRDDYECDYGYYRPDGSDDCVIQPNFRLPKVDICEQGHEEQLITQGYRKIPNDVCRGGFSPDGKKIDLGVTCGTQTSGDISVEEVVQQTETKKTHNASVLVAVCAIIIILVTIMTGFFVYKFIILKRQVSQSILWTLLLQHMGAQGNICSVTYRYSLLNQKDDVNYNDELENQLTKAGLYHDSSDDEELNSPAVKKENGATNSGRTQRDQKPSFTTRRDFQSYHDDSDVDMLS